MEFIHSIHAEAQAVGGSDTSVTHRMPVLPVSAVFLTLEANLASGNTSDNWITLLQALKSIQYRYRGSQIWSVRGDDLYRISRALGVWGFRPEHYQQSSATKRILSLCLPFGRFLFDPLECFPATAQGESELFLDFTAAPSGYNTLIYSVETIQLIDATPTSFLRVATITDTPAATGDKDYDLPRASPLVALGYSMAASEPSTSAHTVERVKLLANNQDYMYANILTHTARAMQGHRRPMGYEMDAFYHIENTAGAYTQNATTLTQRFTNSMASEFGWLPFDVAADGNFLVPAHTFQDFKARFTFNTAAAVRIMPLELWVPDMIRKPGSTVASGTIPARR